MNAMIKRENEMLQLLHKTDARSIVHEMKMLIQESEEKDGRSIGPRDLKLNRHTVGASVLAVSLNCVCFGEVTSDVFNYQQKLSRPFVVVVSVTALDWEVMGAKQILACVTYYSASTDTCYY